MNFNFPIKNSMVYFLITLISCVSLNPTTQSLTQFLVVMVTGGQDGGGDCRGRTDGKTGHG